jgi:hypothetical protein
MTEPRTVAVPSSVAPDTPPSHSTAPRASATRPQDASTASSPIRIERLILHHLDHRAGRCDLVDEVAELDEASERFFSNHLLSAIDRADWRARFRENDSALPEQVTALLGDEARFVAASRALAQRLYDFMRQRAGQIVPGDFVVIAYTGANGAERHVALLKMDPDQQRLTRSFRHTTGGRLRVTIEHAANILPEAKGLQKCALISASASQDSARHFTVRLLDTQAGPKSDGIAAFFYRDFLAATLAASARRQTRLFITESNAWLQGVANSFSPRELLGFYAARRAALASERVDLLDFAARALPSKTDAIPDLVVRLNSALFDLDSREVEERALGEHPFFPVDRAVARKYLEKIVIELDGGARLSVPATRFATLARVLDGRDAEGKALITLASLIFREAPE